MPLIFRFADGSILADAAIGPGKIIDGFEIIDARCAVVSMDNGQTWKDYPQTARTGHDGSRCICADGTALAFVQRTKSLAGKPDTFEGLRWISENNWRSVDGPSPLYVSVPNVVSGHGDGGPVIGPLFHGRSHALKDGTILGTMYTNFVADKKYPREGGRRSPWRSVLVKSTDLGKNWDYVSTIACGDDLADPAFLNRVQNGLCEPSLEIQPDGMLICVMRSGTYVDRREVETYSDQ